MEPQSKSSSKKATPPNDGIGCHTLTQNDPPAWLNGFMKDCVGTRVITAYAGIRTNAGKPREIFLQIDKLLATRRRGEERLRHFQKVLRSLLIDKVPASLTNVIHADDLESKVLANRVVQHFKFVTDSRSIRVLSARKLFRSTYSTAQCLLSRRGVTMVVAGALIMGRRLTNINIALRKLRCERIHYVVGVTRSSSLHELQQTKNTLVGGPSHHGRFSSVVDIFIPDDAPARCPWDRELVTLRHIFKTAVSPDVKRILERRITILAKVRNDSGLRDQLFWNGLTYNAPLKLTRGFRFWKFDYQNASQADVYFTMLATLHHLRNEKAPQRLILSPDSFWRLSDGVIQAALLRVVADGELDYRELPRQSEQMRAQFFSMFSHHENGSGEACIEGLLAILENRLQLRDEDISASVNHLLSSLKRGGRLNCIAELFCEHILKRVGEPTQRDLTS